LPIQTHICRFSLDKYRKLGDILVDQRTIKLPSSIQKW
jgi:hypothetical protein